MIGGCAQTDKIERIFIFILERYKRLYIRRVHSCKTYRIKLTAPLKLRKRAYDVKHVQSGEELSHLISYGSGSTSLLSNLKAGATSQICDQAGKILNLKLIYV